VLTVSVGLLLHSFWRVMHVNPVSKRNLCFAFTCEAIHRQMIQTAFANTRRRTCHSGKVF
jgi:hypothetical protein